MTRRPINRDWMMVAAPIDKSWLDKFDAETKAFQRRTSGEVKVGDMVMNGVRE